MPRFSINAPIVKLMYSGPLSQQIVIACPRHLIIWSSNQTRRAARRGKSYSIPKFSRLKSSITLNRRILRTSHSWLWMISIDQVSLIDIGTDNDSGLALVSHFFGLIRKFNPSSRYIRYTRLWFQPNPLAFPTQRQEAKAKAPSCVGSQSARFISSRHAHYLPITLPCSDSRSG